MVSPPHLPTAHLIVRTVLALVCFSVSTSLLSYTLRKTLYLLVLLPSHSPALSPQSLVFPLTTTEKTVLPLLSLPRIVFLCLVASLTLLSFTARA